MARARPDTVGAPPAPDPREAVNDAEADRAPPAGIADDAVGRLTRRLGERVRAVRKRRGLSRRALAELSGVSPRYLAQLESGEGNTSIALLHRVAVALERPVETLVAADDPLADETGELVRLYRRADAAGRARARQALDPERLRADKAGRICLIGLRGAGKSTLGPMLGEALGVPFVELNRAIERGAGMPVGEIIALYGEAGYRKLEADTLESIVATHERVVLAVAGGVAEVESSFAQLLTRFHTVWIKASAAEHMERVRAQGDLRPMAGNPRAMAQLHDLLRAREARYRRAEHHLDTGGRTVEASRAELVELVRSSGIVAEQPNRAR